MQEIINIITTLGFPMVACIVIYLDSRKDKERLYNALDHFGDNMERFDTTLQSIDKRIEALEERSK